jgi:DNA-binding transcriptional LysR family regulator
MIDFTSRQLRAFLLVAQHRSFSRAAGALFITPSGLSLLIRELEKLLGVRLFDRTTRHVELTASGIELLASVQCNLQELDGAMLRVGRAATEAGTSLSVGAPPLLMTSVLAPAIKEFQSHHADLRFQLFDSDTANVMERVRSGALDMGMGVFFKHLPGIRRTPLFRFSLMVIRAESRHQSAPATTTWSAVIHSSATACRQTPRKGRRRISARSHRELSGYTDRDGRGWARNRHHSFVWTPCMRPSKTRHDPAHQPRGAPRLFADSWRRQKTSSRSRRLHLVPPDLHGQLGRALGDSLARGDGGYSSVRTCLIGGAFSNPQSNPENAILYDWRGVWQSPRCSKW